MTHVLHIMGWTHVIGFLIICAIHVCTCKHDRQYGHCPVDTGILFHVPSLLVSLYLVSL
jgi:hypothetical protein